MATCFVVQGFGKKTDFTDGRVLDLDASYAVIREAVEAAGLECIRADEIQHAGTIDAPMYAQLLFADLVIADLSTYNVNAAFELGIRYGLRPQATLIVAEAGFKNPFDVGHIVIRRYKHLGEDIGAKEAKRFADDLTQAITAILATGVVDSPVYTFLPGLVAPFMKPSGFMPPPLPPSSPSPGVPAGAATPGGLGETPPTAKANLEHAMEKLRACNFVDARALLEEVRRQRPNDSFVTQQLALSIYKSGRPTVQAALDEARAILLELDPATTNDPETLGLWGAIHKRRWEIGHRIADLNTSIDAYGRGFRLKQDCYNGINLAFLLERRAVGTLRAGEHDEGITDATLARRIRREVIAYTRPLIDTERTDEQRYWIFATLWEAAAGLGNTADANAWAAKAQALETPGWMIESTRTQVDAVRDMQAEIARLSTRQTTPQSSVQAQPRA